MLQAEAINVLCHIRTHETAKSTDYGALGACICMCQPGTGAAISRQHIAPHCSERCAWLYCTAIFHAPHPPCSIFGALRWHMGWHRRMSSHKQTMFVAGTAAGVLCCAACGGGPNGSGCDTSSWPGRWGWYDK